MGERLQRWQILFVDNIRYVVINMVEYQEGPWIWQEYEIKNDANQRLWLCVEKNEQGQLEYSIYAPYYGNINTNAMSFWLNNVEYGLYEKGVATVKDYFGNADVDIHERCNFVDYATKDERYFISVEYWDGEVEKSVGEYIDSSRVVITGELDLQKVEEERRNAQSMKLVGVLGCGVFLFPMFVSIFIPMLSGLFINKSIEKYIDKKTANYSYVTSVTNDSNNKIAKVYKSSYSTIDATVKDIIDGVPEGITDTIDADPNTEEDGIGLHTKKEFAYVYLEDDDVYVQVSEKEYVDNDSGSTYHSRRRSYYRSAYRSSNRSSVYSSYSRSARQDSVNSRRSSGGGTSSGK